MKIQSLILYCNQQFSPSRHSNIINVTIIKILSSKKCLAFDKKVLSKN